MSELKVFFFTVKDAKEKVQALIQTATTHFIKKEKIHLIVPDTATLEFVDQLLWNHPPESFLPHSTGVLFPFQDLIFISLPLISFEEFPIVFNLCQTPHSPSKTLKVLYELEDVSHPQKTAVFKNKFEHYQNQGLTPCNSLIC